MFPFSTSISNRVKVPLKIYQLEKMEEEETDRTNFPKGHNTNQTTNNIFFLFLFFQNLLGFFKSASHSRLVHSKAGNGVEKLSSARLRVDPAPT